MEYDAYRTDLEELNLGPRDENATLKIQQSEQQFQVHREKYERMRNDLSVKLKFLEENKVVQPLVLLHIFSICLIFLLSALIQRGVHV